VKKYIFIYFFPNKAFITDPPIFRSSPLLVAGIPVCSANCCFAAVIPRNLLSENEDPRMVVGGLN
jgi:hypothetical protein